MKQERDDFYVGYLPMPPAQRAFLRWIAPSILWTMVLVCGLTLAFLKPAPPARWDTGTLVSLQGVVRAAPHPLIELRGADERLETVLLTGIGKRAAFVPEPFSDALCMVRGYALEREGRRVLELMDGPEAMVRLADQGGAWPRPEPLPLGRAELVGEILDSKCWHGAMRPGEGRAHKACATLCVRGGIAPLLIPARGTRAGQSVLLAAADGSRATTQVLPFLGEPVAVSGELVRQAGMLWLRLDPGGVVPQPRP